MLYRALIRPLLYSLSAETAHRLVMGWMRIVHRSPLLLALTRWWFCERATSLAVDALGLSFPSPLGLAAGLDKDAEAFRAFGALGFGFVEVGTITFEAQPGNPLPRLFRLVPDRALINRMGFNNHGATDAQARLAKDARRDFVLGINIGKTKRVADTDAIDDYVKSARLLSPYADYMVVNVSSPNTPGLRDLQAVERLRPLLIAVREAIQHAAGNRRVPLLVKIAPDLSDADVDAVADMALDVGLDGIIATNTTISREGLVSSSDVVSAIGAGGLSGAPLKARSLAVLRRLRARVGTRLTLIAAGGIESADDAWQRLLAGAELVQVYTALIYEGPTLPQALTRGLHARMKAANVTSLADLKRENVSA